MLFSADKQAQLFRKSHRKRPQGVTEMEIDMPKTINSITKASFISADRLSNAAVQWDYTLGVLQLPKDKPPSMFIHGCSDSYMKRSSLGKAVVSVYQDIYRLSLFVDMIECAIAVHVSFKPAFHGRPMFCCPWTSLTGHPRESSLDRKNSMGLFNTASRASNMVKPK